MTQAKIIRHYLGIEGRMIWHSKSDYLGMFPNNQVVFNANLYLNRVKVWWGDLDLTIDLDALKSIQSETGLELIVLREMDGRFEAEESPNFDNAVLILK